MTKNDISWRVIGAILVVLGWLIFQFRTDVNATSGKVSMLQDYHDDDVESIIREFDKIDVTREAMLAKLAGNEAAHKDIDGQLERMNKKLERIYDLLIKRNEK